MHWESEPDEYYLVTIMHKDSLNNFTEVESARTKNAYSRIDLKYTRDRSFYFAVSAIDDNTGVLIGGSDTICGINPNNPNSFTDRESKICNGKNYAWRLDLNQLSSSAGFQTGVPSKLQLWPTSNYFDEQAGIDVPFYQAIDAVNYNLLSTNHPYRQISNEIYRYKHIQINDSLDGGPFIDAQNNNVYNGWLIEKKLDQFEHFNGDVTNVIYPSSTFPDMTISGWYETFNNSHALVSFSDSFPPANEFSSQYGIPEELTCNGSYGGFSSGGSGGGSFTNEYVASVFGCWLANDDLQSYADCLDEGVLTGGQIITDIIVVPLDKNSFQHHLRRDSITRDFTDLNFNSAYKNGLYEIRIFTDQQQIFHSIVENVSNHNLVEDKDYVKMSINPNPIENNLMRLNIQTQKSMNANLVVYTLDNVVLYDEVIELVTGTIFAETIEITSTIIPYNQIRVKLIFEDQSSMIQKTGLR